MSASLHSLSAPPLRGTEYCVDCYADGGKVTVATRKFGDDPLCERDYLKLCKEMNVEPEVLTLSEANAAKEIAKEAPINKIRRAPTPRPEAGLKPAGHPGSESVAVRVHSDVSRLESTEARGGGKPAAVTIENSFPSDPELAEAAQSLPSQPALSVAPADTSARGRGVSQGAAVKSSAQAEKRVSGSAPARRSTSGRPPLVVDDPCSASGSGMERQHPGADSPDVSTDVIAALGAQGFKLRDAQRAVEQSFKPGDTFNQAFRKAFVIVFAARSAARPVAICKSSQRPDSSVAPAAEGGADRAHSPTQPAPPRSPSAVHSQQPTQRPQPERSAKPMARSETALRNDAGQRVCSCGCGTELRSRHPYIKGHNITPGKPAGSAAPAKRGRKPKTNGHAAPSQHDPLRRLPPLPPVALVNGNGHAPETSNGRENNLVPVLISELHMDRLWATMSPQQKASLMFPAHQEQS